ncbi:hypothetical protein BJY21_003347 [Kineosphaera limosa]|uniref:Methyltransferase n=1 Tax=Kineosphaera limosa NBRC 100340 TaxID=1184609 RepID=K6W4D1_9MICO|nr:class I SAM-dependent methyltransferase [Kineosphaera limosa]NYE02163.1 hypothetical protein [Kineosphaera limosa]GAB94015.1 hypothetical protein KILIM_001_00170 [Kineosphaera limosa NBRC 100340]
MSDATLGAATPVTRCRGCGSDDLASVLDLGPQPACDHFPPADDPGPDPRWPLGLLLCGECALLQLDHDSPAPEEPLAVESATLQRHAVEVIDRLLDRLDLPKSWTYREFASHHGGSWTAALDAHGGVAVEGGAALVIDNQSIIHADDLEPELAQRVAALGDDGLLVIEFHHALRQLLDAQFDTVRHGHPLYFSLHSWSAACARHGLTVVDAWEEDVFGGCLVVVARRTEHAPAHPSGDVERILAAERAALATTPTGYESLAARARAATDGLRDLLEEEAAGRSVAAYGAGSKAVTFLNVAGIGADLVPLVADLSPGKQGRRLPGAHIRIVSPEELVAAAPDVVAVLTWDIAPEVVGSLRDRGLHARFVVPLPTLTDVD